MSVAKYDEQFARLRMNRTKEGVSPHKVAMLLAVADLIESGKISNNQIRYNDELLGAFDLQFAKLATEKDRNSPHLPYFHLGSEGFWKFQTLPGMEASWNQLKTVSSATLIREHVLFAYLDEELFELLRIGVVREHLKSTLLGNIELTAESRRKSLGSENGDWSWLECEVVVQDYFSMLAKELRGEKYNKQAHRSLLIGNLNGRSEGSIEFKHQNISAILVELNITYISGYKPRSNYQTLLKEAVLAHLATGDILGGADAIAIAPETPPYVINWSSVQDVDLPELLPQLPERNRKFLGRFQDYTKKESANRHLGENGEKFILEYEEHRLRRAGRDDLANKIEWSSKLKGDGLGYDILSYCLVDSHDQHKEMYIEVKTTSRGKYQPFFVSENELAFSRQSSENYSLYRVYDFGKSTRFFELPGRLDNHVNLQAENYRATFSQ
jgi:hypothetical protein